MGVRFGVSPIAWANDDMPELGGATSVEAILDDAAALGFAGVELGGRFPREAPALSAMLAPRRLKLIGGWWSMRLLERSAEDEFAAFRAHLGLLQVMGSPVFIAAECARAIHGERATPMGAAPRLGDGDWPAFGERIASVARRVAEAGLRFAYHFHLGTVVERPEDLDRLIAATPDEVGLVVDTGHAALAGIDAAALVRRHPRRVAHVHAKDIRRRVFDDIQARRASFLDGVVAGMFTAPGDGDLDFAPVMRALAEAHYRGWIVVEAEQDPAIADPRAMSRLGLETVKRSAAGAGLT
jgi:inosose dehydratase